MKRTIIFIIPVFFLSSPLCRAQTDIDSLLSLDISYALVGLFSHGGGIGVNYEKKLFDHLSVKGNFGHMTFLTGIKNVYCTSVHLSAFANYYPLGGGLDKSYIGVGAGCDFMNYFGSGELPNTNQDTLIHITPQTGWKFKPVDFLMIDVSIGYKFFITKSQNYREIENYVNSGFRFGINILIFFKQFKKDETKIQDG
jgi:hypothetical protein